MSRPPSIQTLLIRLVLLVWVPSVLVIWALVGYGYERVMLRIEDSTLTMARALGAGVDARFLELRSGLQALAGSPALAQGDMAAFHEHAKKFLAANQLALDVVLVDRSGKQVLNTVDPVGGVTPSAPPGPELMALFSGGELAVTDTYQSSVLHLRVVAVGVPRRDANGVVTHVIFAGVDPSEFTRVLLHPRLPAGWTVALLDRHGTIVTRVPQQGDVVGQPAIAELQKELAARDEGTFTGTAGDGTKVLGAFNRASVSGYAVAIGVPEQELLGTVRRTAAIVGAVMCTLLAVFLVAALAMARRISGATRELASAATRVGRSSITVDHDSVFREAQQVQMGLNIATAELQHADAAWAHMDEALAAGTVGALRDIVHAAMEPMLVFDEHYMIIAANPACASLLARSLEDLQGRSVADVLVHPPPPQHGMASFEVAGLRSDGSTVELLMNVSSFLAGRERLFAASFRDRSGYIRAATDPEQVPYSMPS